MRIRALFGYDSPNHYFNHVDCERHYCREHRLLFRSCQRVDGDCPWCASDFAFKHDMRLWTLDQTRRQIHG